MSGVNIAGLVGKLRHFATHLGCSRALNQVCSDAADALTAQAAELAVARAEIGRVRVLVDYERSERTKDAAEYESATRSRDEALAALKVAEEALRPFADAIHDDDSRVADRCDIWESPVAMNITFGNLRRARSALENSKARLADATPKNPGTEQREAGR